jgi:hypothetical protein
METLQVMSKSTQNSQFIGFVKPEGEDNYMNDYIKVDEIECMEIKENILACNEAINYFITVINRHLLDEMKLDLDKMCFEILRKDGYAYKNDGNTRCDGYDYKVLWAIDLTGKQIKNSDYFFRGWYQNAIYFIYEQTERIFDHKATRLRVFSLYVSGTETRNHDKFINRIDYNNDNMQLTSIINHFNAAECLKAIKENIEFNNLVKSLEKEF